VLECREEQALVIVDVSMGSGRGGGHPMAVAIENLHRVHEWKARDVGAQPVGCGRLIGQHDVDFLHHSRRLLGSRASDGQLRVLAMQDRSSIVLPRLVAVRAHHQHDQQDTSAGYPALEAARVRIPVHELANVASIVCPDGIWHSPWPPPAMPC
jgi:hypothetical protein